ncbi:MAG: TRAP transporter large permease [Spirochaetota bacterium]
MSIALIVVIVIFVLTFLLRLPIALGMLSAGVFYLLLTGQDIGLVADQVLSNLFAKDILLAVPLFVFTAMVMNSGKVTDRLFNFANVLVGRWKGGLGHVNVVASLIFSGMTGSAIADASGLGIMEIDSMRRAGYDDGFSCAITASSAVIGPIFPPSIPMVFYAMLSGTSIGALLLGGMIPGVFIAAALMVYVAIIANIRNYPKGPRYALRDFIIFTIKAIPALLTPVILLLGIYTGIMTPTEAGAVAALYALVISIFVYRAMGLKELIKVLIETVKTTGSLGLIVGSAFMFSYIVASEHIPDYFANLLMSITSNRYVLFLIVNIIFLLLGMFIDTSTITVVFIPMVLPLIQMLGIDLVHFGVVIVLNMMVGLLTPPFGMLLFIVSGISGAKLQIIIKESLPMILVLIIVLFILTYIPEIILFLPNLIGK